jgi:hypothetical protein
LWKLCSVLYLYKSGITWSLEQPPTFHVSSLRCLLKRVFSYNWRHDKPSINKADFWDTSSGPRCYKIGPLVSRLVFRETATVLGVPVVVHVYFVWCDTIARVYMAAFWRNILAFHIYKQITNITGIQKYNVRSVVVQQTVRVFRGLQIVFLHPFNLCQCVADGRSRLSLFRVHKIFAL